MNETMVGLSMISLGSTLAEDIRHALAHWDGLTRFLSDGRLELDTSLVELAIRPNASLPGFTPGDAVDGAI